jgi:ribonuclease P protein component
MPHLQPTIEILKGFGTFTKVITRGKRYEKQPIKAFVITTLSKKPSLHVGYATTKKIRKSAHRNRLKRLMRAAVFEKKTDFIRNISPETLVEIVFMYNGSAENAPTMAQYSSINLAISELCTMIFKE